MGNVRNGRLVRRQVREVWVDDQLIAFVDEDTGMIFQCLDVEGEYAGRADSPINQFVKSYLDGPQPERLLAVAEVLQQRGKTVSSASLNRLMALQRTPSWLRRLFGQ